MNGLRVGDRVVAIRDGAVHGEVVRTDVDRTYVLVAPGRTVALPHHAWELRSHLGGIGAKPDALRSNGLGGTVQPKRMVAPKAPKTPGTKRVAVDAQGRITAGLTDEHRLVELRNAQRGKRTYWFIDANGRLESSAL